MLKVNLFFDESGKNDDAVKTMGSLMIPEKVYNCKEIVALNERLRKEEFELHWTKYNGGNSEAKIYKEIVEAFSKYLSLFSSTQFSISSVSIALKSIAAISSDCFAILITKAFTKLIATKGAKSISV